MKLHKKIAFMAGALLLHPLVQATAVTMADIDMDHKTRVPIYQSIPGKAPEIVDITDNNTAEDIETPVDINSSH
jgi:hypothetical protein